MLDARGTYGMSPEIWYIHQRLQEWGKWASKGSSEVRGFPTRSAHEGIKEGGIAAGMPKPPIEIPEAVAYTDAAVARLKDIDKTVVQTYYLVWAPIETLWQRCTGIRSERNFRAVLTRARWRVRATLEQLEVT